MATPQTSKEDDVKIGKQILEILAKDVTLDQEDRNAIISLITFTSNTSFVVSITDYLGLNILQYLIIRNLPDVVQYLISRSCDLKLENIFCSHPLHLACKLGRSSIVRLLLDQPGCDVTITCSVCYPFSGDATHRQKWLGVDRTTKKPVYECTPRMTPIECCILHDKHEAFATMYAHMTRGNMLLDAIDEVFQTACQMKAAKILSWLLLNTHLSAKGRCKTLNTAAHHSIECLFILLRSSVEWIHTDFLNFSGLNGSIFHTVFSKNYSKQNSLELLKLAVRVGCKDILLYTKNVEGNTFFKILVLNIDFPKIPCHIVSKQTTEHISPEQVWPCVQFLLELGVELKGENVVSHLLRKFKAWMTRFENQPCKCYSRERQQLHQVNRLLHLFIKYDAPVDIPVNVTSITTSHSMQTLSDFLLNNDFVFELFPQMLSTLKMLIHGTKFQKFVDSEDATHRIVFRLWQAACYWTCTHPVCQIHAIDQCVLSRSPQLTWNSQLSDEWLDCVNFTFQCRLLETKEYLFCMSTELIKLIQQCLILPDRVVDQINQMSFFAPFFTCGLDPNLTVTLSYPLYLDQNSDIINQLIHVADKLECGVNPNILGFFSVFHNTLSESKRSVIVNIITEIASIVEQRGCSVLAKNILVYTHFFRSVRSLKQLSRIVISRCLQWKTKLFLPGLPLPKELQRYILYI